MTRCGDSSTQWQTVSRFYYGDYYPLTPYTRENTTWIAWQFHDPEYQPRYGAGVPARECNEPSATLKLSGLDPDAQYECTQFDVAGTTTLSGQELMNTGLQRVAAGPTRRGRVHVSPRARVSWSVRVICRRSPNQELMEYVQHLADDAMEGRQTNTPGGKAAGRLSGPGNARTWVCFPRPRTAQYIQDCGNGCRNVLGLLKGSDPAVADETVIVGGHYDHVGMRRRRGDGETVEIYNGANDNASGVAGVLEIAEAMTKLPQAPRRSILFALWDGEERGFVGSKFFVSHPSVKLEQVTAVLAVDMVGRVVDDQLIVWGTGTAAAWPDILTAANAGPQLKLDLRPFTLALSDHLPFFCAAFPPSSPARGMFPELHRTTDDVELLNPDGMRRYYATTARRVCELAGRTDRLDFLEASRTEVTTDVHRKADDPAQSAEAGGRGRGSRREEGDRREAEAIGEARGERQED